MLFAAKYTNLEIMTVSEVNQRQVLYEITYTWNLKKWCKWTHMQGRKNPRDMEYEFMITKVERCGSSVQFSHSVVSDSLQPHRLQYTRLPCPSSTPRAYTSSCPLSQWCHAIISSSLIPFSHLQSFPASGPFPVSQFSTPGGQIIAVSASASVLRWIFRTDFP